MSDQTTGRWLNAAESGQVAEALAAVRSALMCHEPLTERLDIAIFAALALLRPAADDRQAALEACAEALREIEHYPWDVMGSPVNELLAVKDIAHVALKQLAASGDQA